MLFAFGAIVVGLVLLIVGADLLVESAASLARKLGLSAVLVGALVVGLGTSAPEFLVSGLAAARGELELAVGNIVGSNVANVTLVLGAAAIVAPIVSRRDLLRREGALMMIAVALFAIALADLRIGRWEAAALAGGMVVSAVLIARWSQKDAAAAGRQLRRSVGIGRSCPRL